MSKEEMKQLLEQAWKEVFGVESVSDDDDFFDIGGDSIKAVQLVSWLVQKGVKVDMMSVFSAPRFGDIAETLEETKPMYVPDTLLNKDMIAQAMANPEKFLNQQKDQAEKKTAPEEPQQEQPAAEKTAAPKQPQQNQQLCTPGQNQGQFVPGQNRQLCTPAQWNQYYGQQNVVPMVPNYAPMYMPQSYVPVCWGFVPMYPGFGPMHF